jgi:predicted RNA-binding Zn-ribbon protein involved in translation (DUF1610 family)
MTTDRYYWVTYYCMNKKCPNSNIGLVMQADGEVHFCPKCGQKLS